MLPYGKVGGAGENRFDQLAIVKNILLDRVIKAYVDFLITQWNRMKICVLNTEDSKNK